MVTLKLTPRLVKECPEIEIHNVPTVWIELATNLLSVSQMLKKDNSVEFECESCKMYNAHNVWVAKAFISDGVYKLDKSEMCLLTGQVAIEKLSIEG